MTKLWTLKADINTPDDWGAILRQYEKMALDIVYAHPNGVGSGAVWSSINKMLGPERTISRASVIFALNRFVNAKVLGFDEATGKGGHHRLYKPIMTWSEFEELVIWRFIEKLMLIFPEKDSLREKAERLKVQT